MVDIGSNVFHDPTRTRQSRISPSLRRGLKRVSTDNIPSAEAWRKTRLTPVGIAYDSRGERSSHEPIGEGALVVSHNNGGGLSCACSQVV